MKKMIKILLAIWLVVFIVGCTTNENGKEVDIEDGDGDGDDIDIEETFKDTVYISTEEHIRGLADLVNSGSDYFDEKIIVMTNDITLSQNHTPIGKAAGKFTSTFDGNGYSISNLSVERTQYAGLFGYVGEGGRIRNLTVNVVEITAGGTTANYAGGLAGYYASTKAIVNCGVNIKNEILAYCSYESYAGGLIGKTVTDITINNSYSTGGLVIAHNSGSTTSGSDNYAGGLIGQAYNNIEITYCYAMTKVSANTTVSSIPGGLVGTGFSASGGLVGLAQKDIDITNSYTTGDIVGNTNIGGLIGEVKGKTTINYSYTTGYVHGSNYNGSGSGGLVGHSGAIIIGNSYSEGDVSASNSSNAGGLVGIAKTLEITVTDCHSTGDVRGSWSGGLIGYVSGWPTTVTTIKDSYTTGNVSANGEDSGNAGGLIGSGTGSIFIDNSHATGNVSAFSYAGGFMGYG
ncbi:MAG: hypothetical protein LBH98_07470, partial [Chitinispirillales bacterium]|nr:hypothetical protein [Chitinispirillales bacterium]